MKQLFRYQLSYYLECDQEDGEISRIKAEMLLRMIDVISETKCTYVVKDHNGKIRRIFKNACNTYAHEKKEDALKCFYHRTNTYRNILYNKSMIIKNLLKNVLKENRDIFIFKY